MLVECSVSPHRSMQIHRVIHRVSTEFSYIRLNNVQRHFSMQYVFPFTAYS